MDPTYVRSERGGGTRRIHQQAVRRLAGQEQPWRRQRRLPDEREWYATTGGTAEVDAEAEFDSVEDAIAWGRKRAEIVLVRLGGDVEAHYSAGSRAATWLVDGSGWPFPHWPPSSWPNYAGPPEPGWPEYFE
jgi:hypothetical protein